MASEIRANKQTNRVGLGTVTYTDTGIIVSGIVTANSFKGDGSSLTGIDATALKDTAGAVKIQANSSGAVHSGISTFNEIKLGDGKKIILGNDTDIQLFHDGGFNKLFTSNNLLIGNSSNSLITLYPNNGGVNLLYSGGHQKLATTLHGVVVTGILTATSFSGTLAASNLTGALPAISGANLTNLPPSAPVGGASTNQVFFENDKEVAVNYQITSTKNAMSAGPLQINAGIAVTVPSGCSWTIV